MQWKSTWGYLAVNYNSTIGHLEKITQQTSFWNNLNGNKVRILFSNKYSDEKIVFSKVTIALQEDTKLTEIPITKNGKEKIEIDSNETFYSDEIDFSVVAGKNILITCYIDKKITIKSAVANWAYGNWQTHYITQDGKVLECHEVFEFMKFDKYKTTILVGISQIDVLTSEDVKQITLFGDSITHMSFYCNALMEIFYKKYKGKVSIINCGYGGNRVLKDASYIANIPGNGACAGIAGVNRFESDVFENSSPNYVFILEGINDLMHPYAFDRMNEMPTVEELTDGFKNFYKIAKRKNVKLYFGTILPFESEEYPFGKQGEEIRVSFNKWVKGQNLSDGVFDFDSYLSDKDSSKLKTGLDIGDGLHPGVQGGIKMADLVNITFKW